MVDVVEEPFDVKQENTCLEASSVGALDVVKECKSRVQAGRVGAAPELIGVNEFVRVTLR
jgi:hypothetical protein